MGVAASSSSSSSSKKYEVFLSFRGEDTRRSFTSHLHTALCLKGIETFIDYELPKGDDISQSLIQAIQDSSLSVIVFSENYATSKWCLNELIEILRCKQEQGQHVVPIFYQVDPSHVRHQRGTYEKAFEEHLKKNPDKVDEWRRALLETGKLAGWDSCNCRTIEQWESALSKLERRIHPNIQDVLKLSYDGLDDEEKEVFLDIACFLKGESEGYVLAMLESYGFHAHIGLGTLMDKALITIDNVVVWMHDLIQSMAFEIVRQECPRNPERRSRLLIPDEIYDVLKNNQGTDAIQGISLDLSRIGDLQLSADTLKKMTNLRFLKFYSSWAQRSCTVNLPAGLDSFSKSLCYLQWDNFPLESLPLPFCAEKLVKLHMPNSHLKKLWDGMQNLMNLREIILDGSKYLMELPDISMAQNLEWLSLESCESLSYLNQLSLSHPRLHIVSLNYCGSLKSLKIEGQSKSISNINVIGCFILEEFSFSSNKIYKLNLSDTPIEILDFPIGHMEDLV